MAGPGLLAPPKSKPLRFRHSGSPQRHRFGWACILCPSQDRAAQVTWCLASMVAATYHLPRPCCLYNWHTFTGMPCVSPGELISGCDPPGRCQPSRISGSNWEPAHNLVEDAISGAEIAPCLLALAVTSLPLCLWWENGPVRRQLASSILCSMSVFLNKC